MVCAFGGGGRDGKGARGGRDAAGNLREVHKTVAGWWWASDQDETSWSIRLRSLRLCFKRTGMGGFTHMSRPGHSRNQKVITVVFPHTDFAGTASVCPWNRVNVVLTLFPTFSYYLELGGRPINTVFDLLV